MIKLKRTDLIVDAGGKTALYETEDRMEEASSGVGGEYAGG